MNDSIIKNIAKEHFGIDMMEALDSDVVNLKNCSVDKIKLALREAFEAGIKSVNSIKEAHIPALLKNSQESKRARELAGIPHKGNYL